MTTKFTPSIRSSCAASLEELIEKLDTEIFNVDDRVRQKLVTVLSLQEEMRQLIDERDKLQVRRRHLMQALSVVISEPSA